MAAAISAMTACSKEQSACGELSPSDNPSITVSIEGSADTRATGIKGDDSDEEKIRSLQVFVFNGEIIDGYGHIENSKTLTLGCTAGVRDIYAIANAPDLKDVKSRSELLGKVSALKPEVDGFEMFGLTKDKEIKSDTKDALVHVDRFAARIKVKKITNALSSPALQNQNFIIESMNISNVAADVDYGISSGYQISQWYNQMGFEEDNNCGNVTSDTVGEPLASGSSYTVQHCFYAYPNSNAFSSDLTWSPRATMLVLKIRIGTALYNYPIKLPALERNRSYEIDEIKITRPGNLDNGEEGGPDEMEPVQGADCIFEIKVNPWTVVTVTEGVVI